MVINLEIKLAAKRLLIVKDEFRMFTL